MESRSVAQPWPSTLLRHRDLHVSQSPVGRRPRRPAEPRMVHLESPDQRLHVAHHRHLRPHTCGPDNTRHLPPIKKEAYRLGRLLFICYFPVFLHSKSQPVPAPGLKLEQWKYKLSAAWKEPLNARYSFPTNVNVPAVSTLHCQLSDSSLSIMITQLSSKTSTRSVPYVYDSGPDPLGFHEYLWHV